MVRENILKCKIRINLMYFFCRLDLSRQGARIFSEEHDSNVNVIECPGEFECIGLFHDTKSVCCPKPDVMTPLFAEKRPQSSNLLLKNPNEWQVRCFLYISFVVKFLGNLFFYHFYGSLYYENGNISANFYKFIFSIRASVKTKINKRKAVK